MIRYTLRCADGHEFDGWFRSSTGFEQMSAAGQVACTICGDTRIVKAPMAPAVPSDRASGREPAPRPGAPAPGSVTERVQQSLAELRQYVESNCEYVGMRFVQQARAMHEGRIEERPIHGEACIEEARKLIEDGVPVAPLPFRSRQRMN